MKRENSPTCPYPSGILCQTYHLRFLLLFFPPPHLFGVWCVSARTFGCVPVACQYCNCFPLPTIPYVPLSRFCFRVERIWTLQKHTVWNVRMSVWVSISIRFGPECMLQRKNFPSHQRATVYVCWLVAGLVLMLKRYRFQFGLVGGAGRHAW